MQAWARNHSRFGNRSYNIVANQSRFKTHSYSIIIGCSMEPTSLR